MNISDNIIQTNTQGYGTLQSGAVKEADGGAALINDANKLITQTSEGDIFQGKIVDITNDKVQILLGNNQTLQARMEQALSLNIGDELQFMVKENNGQSVYIKPVAEQQETFKDSALSKILEGNNLSPTEKNYQIAESLMNHNMPVDRASMQKVMQQSYKFPDATIDNIVNMNKLGIPVNETNLSQYQDMLNNNHQLAGNINDFANSVVNFTGEQVTQLETGNLDISQFNQNIDSIMEIVSDAADMPAPEFTEALETLNQQDNQEAGLNRQSVNGQPDTVNQTGNTVHQNGADVVSRLSQNDVSLDNANSKPELVQSVSDNLSEKLSLDKNNLENLIGKLQGAGVSDDKLKLLQDKSDTPMQLMNNVNELLKSLPENTDGKLSAEIMKSKDFQELLSASVNRKLTLDAEKMEDPKELSDLYKSIYEKADKLMNTFQSQGGAAGEQMQNSGKSMQERMDFVQNLNELFSYAQIPFNVSGNETNSELFVYMNKGKKLDVSKEVSALLHLDMDHLGATDVHVSLSGDTVHTRFYVDDEESARIIDEHMTMLEKAVNGVGYSLSNETVTRNQSINSTGNKVVDELLGKDLEQSIKRYSFDVKM
jgi:hypothetical protein